jgi:HSP20 family protein
MTEEADEMTLPVLRRSSSTPERWHPFRELDEVTNQMRKVLDDTFGGAFGTQSFANLMAWSPLVDLEETDDAYVVEAELPGVKRGDVDIELVGNELVISGEVKERERMGVLRRQTRRTGNFNYRVTLPDTVDADKVDASLADGVLTVRVPKSEKARRRKIEIKA